LDEVGDAQGRRIATAYHVMNYLDANEWLGLDIETWVKEGLVDILIPAGCHAVGAPAALGGTERFADIVKDTECQLYPDSLPRIYPAPSFVPAAMAEYGAGADGLTFWDADGRMLRCSEWAVQRELGHRDLPAGKGSNYFRQIPLTRLHNFQMDRRNWPMTGG